VKRVLPALWFLLLALLVTWPTVLDPVGQVVGHEQTSTGSHVWVLWWAQNHLDQVVTDLIFFPHGADVIQLYGSDLLSPVLLGRLPLPPTTLHNLWAWFLLTMGGLGSFLLCRHRGIGAWGALLGGTVFTTAPFFQHELLNGTTEIVAAAALPWLAWALLALLERPTPLRGAAVGLVTGLAVLASAYNLFFSVLLGLCVLVWRIATSQEPFFTWAMARAAACAAGVAAIFAAPLAWLQLSHGAKEVYSRRADWMNPELALPDSYASLLDWVDPRAASIPFDMVYPGDVIFEYWTTKTVYLGLAALGLAVLALLRRRGDGLFLGVLSTGVLVAMGAWLRLDTEPILVAGHAIGLPSQLLAEIFPPFVVTAVHSYRYAALAVLGLAVLAARGLDRWFLVLPAVALILADAVFFSPVPWPAAVTTRPGGPVLEQLAAAPDGAVLVAPIEGEHLGDLSLSLILQTVHGKPFQDGGIHRRAGEGATLLFEGNQAVGGLASFGGPQLPGPQARATCFTHLREIGYRYVLVRSSSHEVLQWVYGELGNPDAKDEAWVLWELG
jgi:hypothetical protein